MGLEIEICPHEPRASLAAWDKDTEANLFADLSDCVRSGDAIEACQYVLDQWKPAFYIVARDPENGLDYRRRLATDQEMADTCRAIYFESETDFDDMGNARLYLMWEVASNKESEDES